MRLLLISGLCCLLVSSSAIATTRDLTTNTAVCTLKLNQGMRCKHICNFNTDLPGCGGTCTLPEGMTINGDPADVVIDGGYACWWPSIH